MATETLRLDIVANNKDAVAALKQTDAELRKVSSTALKTGTDVAKGSNQAAFALTNLGRIAQDAPFGFIGIQNNLNPMLESFQRLQKETGSAGSALKAMASSLIGPAGLGLALSVGGAALLMFGDRLFGTKKQTEDTKKASQEYTRQLQEQSRAATDAVTKVAALVSAGLSEEATLKQRKEILKQLNKESSTYFGNLRIEKGEISGLIEAYGMYAQNIFKVAKAKGAAQQVEKLSKELLSSTTNLKGLTDELTNLNLANSLVGGPKQVEKNLNEIEGILKKVLFSQEDIKRVSDLTGISEANVNDLLKRRSVERTKELRLTAQILDLSKFANQETLSSLAVTKEKAEKEFDILKYRQKMNGLFQESLLGTPEVFAPKEKAAKMTGGVPQNAAEIDKMITEARLRNMEKIRQRQEEDAEYAETSLARQAQIYNGILTPAISTMFNALANGKNVLGSLGDMFKQLTIQIATALAKTAALAGIISLLSGGKINFGDAFKLASGLRRGLPQFANGGIASGPSSGYPAILHGTEAVLNPKQFKNLTSNMMNVGAMRGMGQMQPANGQVVLRGQDLVLALDRAGVNLNLRRG
jgi:endonuclease III